MKYFATLAFSVVLLIGFMVRANFMAVLRSFIHKIELEKDKKSQFSGLIIFWAISTIALFVFVIFFFE